MPEFNESRDRLVSGVRAHTKATCAAYELEGAILSLESTSAIAKDHPAMKALRDALLAAKIADARLLELVRRLR